MIVRALEAVSAPELAVTRTVKGNVAAAVGVPLIIPFTGSDMDSPVGRGSDPGDRVQFKDVVVGVAVNVCE